MIIMFEGPDGSGKSTLLTKIHEYLIEKYYIDRVDACGNYWIPTHPKAPDRVSEEQLFSKLEAMIKDDTVYLIDRGPISDCVYRVFDDNTTVTSIDKVKEFINKYNTKFMLIYCKTPDAEKYMRERGEDNPTSLQRHKELTKVYDLVMNLLKTKYNYIQYDFTVNKTKKILDTIDYFVFMNSKEKER